MSDIRWSALNGYQTNHHLHLLTPLWWDKANIDKAIKAGTLSDVKDWKSSMQLYCDAQIPALKDPLSAWGHPFAKGPPPS